MFVYTKIYPQAPNLLAYVVKILIYVNDYIILGMHVYKNIMQIIANSSKLRHGEYAI